MKNSHLDSQARMHITLLTATLKRKNIQLAESLGITNHTIYFNEVDGIKIAKHIEATVLSTLNRTEHLDKVAEVLKVIHNSGLKAENDYGLLERLTSYEKIITSD